MKEMSFASLVMMGLLCCDGLEADVVVEVMR